MYADTSSLLEAVFVDLAPEAANIADIYLQDGADHWHCGPLTYAELAEWTGEIATAADGMPAGAGSR